MKKVLLAGTAAAALFLATGVTRAADIVAEPVPMTDWSGLYIGGHVGFGVVDMSGCYDCDIDTSDSELYPGDLDLDGLVGGIHAGVNFQMEDVVVGIEGDVTLTDINDSGLQPSADSTDQHGDVDLLASVRARLGVAMDDVLVFATAGIAFPDADWNVSSENDSDTFNLGEIGGVVGGGFEFAGTENIRWRVEGLYYFFDESESIEDVESANAGEEVGLDDAIVIRGGVSFYLNI